MKHLYKIALAFLLVSLHACSDDIRIMLDIPDADIYSQVYMPQSNDNPNSMAVYVCDSLQYLHVNAFLGGVKAAKSDIKAEFRIRPDLVDQYNEENGTKFLKLPEGACTIEQAVAVIKAGENCSDILDVTIDASGLTITRNYLLPVEMTCTDEKMAEGKNIAYFALAANYPPGEDPRDHIMSFGGKVIGALFSKDSDIIHRDDNNGANLVRYARQEDGTYKQDRVVGWGWINFDPIFYMPPYDFVFKLGDTFKEFAVTGDYAWGAGAFVHRFGWSEIYQAWPFKDKAVLAVVGDALQRFTVVHLDASNWIIFEEAENSGVVVADSGWGGYRHLFCLGNHIVAVDDAGVMYAAGFSDEFVLGELKQVSTGWDIYDKMFPCEDKLIVVDEGGEMYRMEIEL